MPKVLILFAHPALQKSRVNRVLAEKVRSLEGVTFHDLYEAYPEFDIDVEQEQTLLVDHDIIIFQHPFFWYSTPAILKEWQDLVLEHGWAYGTKGTKLQGKMFLSVVSTGGREEAYKRGGYNRFAIRDLLAPIEQTARLCGMEYLPPFIVGGTHQMGPEAIQDHAERYHDLVRALRDDRINLKRAGKLSNLNVEMTTILAEAGVVGGR